MPYIGRDLNRGNYLKLDDISSSFNGSTQTFNLTVGGSAFTPGSAFSILVSVGGVIQEPESAYQINNSEITFANAPTASDGFFCIALGMPIGVGVPGNGTVNGTQIAKPFNYDGFFYLNDGTNRVGINSSSPSETLDIIGNTKISGDTSISGDVNVSGILTATSFSGPTVNTSGISTFYDLRVSNNLTVEGTTTTLDTNLTGVDRVEINANSNTNAAIVGIQSGSAEIVKLLDGTDEVLKVNDGGLIDIASYIRHIGATGTSVGFPDTGSRIIATTNGSTRFTLDGDGRILVGITTATFLASQGGSDLLIEKAVGAGGTVSIDIYSKNATGNSFVRFYNGSQSGKIGLVGIGHSLTFCAAGVNAERMRLTNIGLGIKNNNPKSRLTVGTGLANYENGGILVQNVSYSSNQDKPYLIAASQNWTGATSNWGTYGFQHRLKVDSGGSPRVTIDNQNGEIICFHSSKEVGIGTDNPQSLLHLHGAGGSASGLLIRNAHDIVSAYFQDNNNDSDFLITYSGTGGAELTLHADGNLGLNESNGDDVIIGADQSTGSAKFSVSKSGSGITTAIGLSNGGGNGSRIMSSKSLVLSADTGNDSGAEQSYIGFETDGAEKVRITSGGNVGIGTDNPDELLELAGADPVLKIHDSAGGSTHGLKVNHDGVNATIDLESAGLLSIKQTNGNAAGNGIAFNTGTVDTEKLRITGDGNIGIGTNNPSGKLDISAANSTDMLMFKNGATNFARMGYNSTSGTPLLDVRSEGHIRFLNGTSERIRFLDNGNIHIAWNDGKFLGQLYDSDYYMGLTFGANSRTLFIDNRSNDTRADIAFRTIQAQSTPIERLRITSDGTIRLNDNNLELHGPGSNVTTAYNTAGWEKLVFNPSYNDVARGPNKIVLQDDTGGAGWFAGFGVHTNTLAIYSGGDTVFRQDSNNSNAAGNFKMIIKEDGDVGIGTENPTDILDINSDSPSAVTNMYLRNHATLGGAALNIWTQGTYSSPAYKTIIGCSDAGGNIRMGAVSNHDLLLLTNNDAKITIKSGGRIGFNEDSPSKQFSYAYTESANYSSTNAVYEFLLWNKANISSYPTCGASIQLRAGNTSAGGGNITGVRRGGANQGDLAFSTTDASGNPVEKLRITSGGKVGIGTNDPHGLFDVHASQNDANNKQYSAFEEKTNGDGKQAFGLTIRSNAQNSSGLEPTAFIKLEARPPSLNGSHGGNGIIAFSPIGVTQGTYGSGNLDFYIRNGGPYTFDNDPGNAGEMSPKVRILGGTGVPTLLIGQTSAHADSDGWTLRGGINSSSCNFTSTDVRTFIDYNSYHSTGSKQAKVSFISDGQIYARTTTIQAYSSERRTKKNIVPLDLTKAWNTLRDTPFYTFNYKEETDGTRLHHGPIVDECPEDLILPTKDEDEVGVINTVYTEKLQYRAYSALQQALKRIEQLEAEVTALKSS
jgi:hypothetical protein